MAANVYRGVPLQGARNRSQALTAAAGNATPRPTVAAAKTTANTAQARWRELGAATSRLHFAGVEGDAADRRFAEGPRPRLLAFAVNQFDDAQQLVAKAGELCGEQSGELLQAALPPNPTMQLQRHDRAAAHRADPYAEAQPAGRIPKAVQRKDTEKRQYYRADGRACRFRHLDRPYPAAKRVQLRLETSRQTQRLSYLCYAHNLHLFEMRRFIPTRSVSEEASCRPR